jgi:SAM-dependent methyltransferase
VQPASDHIPCPLCGGWNHRQRFVARDRLVGRPGAFPVVQCAGCGLTFLNPRPTPDSLGAYYPDIYYPLDAEPAHSALAIAHGLLSRVETWLSRTDKGHVRLLDVGCGTGLFLHLAQQRGLRVKGIELSGSAAAYARHNYALDVQEGTVESVELAPQSFDIITMWHVLEHLPDPVATLRHLDAALAPGGLLLAGVPNIGSLEARIFGRRWFSLDAPRHLTHFSPATLAMAAAKAGLDVERIVHSDGTAGLVYSLMGDLTGVLQKTRGRQLSDAAYHRVARVLHAACSPVCWLLARLGQGGALEMYARKPSEPRG